MLKRDILRALFLAIVMCSTSHAAFNESLSRLKRYLVYPELKAEVPEGRRRQHSRVEFRLGFGLPVDLEDGELEVASELKAEYELPTEASEITGEATELGESGAERRLSAPNRGQIYALLENIFNRFGFDGKSCILRMICEAAQMPIETGWTIAGELLHVIFTPSSTDEHLTYPLSDYRGAEHVARHEETDCYLLYSECQISMLGLISKLY